MIRCLNCSSISWYKQIYLILLNYSCSACAHSRFVVHVCYYLVYSIGFSHVSSALYILYCCTIVNMVL